MEVTKDKGWSWIILAAGFGCSFLIFGTMAGGGIFYKLFVDIFKGNHFETIWVIFSITFCMNITGPLATYLGQRFSYRVIVVLGGFIASCGLGASALATSIYYLYGTLGVIYGFGIGLVLYSHIIVVNFSFEKYRALANGIFSSGASIGSVVVPPLLEFLNENYGLKGVFIIWSAVILNICVCGSTFRNIGKTQTENKRKDNKIIKLQASNDAIKGILSNVTDDVTNSKDVSLTRKKEKPFFSIFTRESFWIIALGWCFSVFSSSCFAVILPDFAISQNNSISLSNASFLVSFWALGDLAGRITSGWILDRKWVKLIYFYIFTMSSGAIVAIVTQLFYSYTVLALSSFLYGLFLGSSIMQHPLLIIKCLGIDAFQTAFGSFSVLTAINLIGLTSAVGVIRDSTKSNRTNYTLIGVLLLLPPLAWIIRKIIFNCKLRRKLEVEP